jgi:hypothetical protein
MYNNNTTTITIVGRWMDIEREEEEEEEGDCDEERAAALERFLHNDLTTTKKRDSNLRRALHCYLFMMAIFLPAACAHCLSAMSQTVLLVYSSGQSPAANFSYLPFFFATYPSNTPPPHYPLSSSNR